MSLSFLANPPPAREPNLWEYAPGKFLAWNEYGDPLGKPVFYFHGWPNSRLQARLAHHLARERGLRLIADWDRPGMGKSTFVAGRKLGAWPPLMTAFADHLGLEKFGQIGVSGGGPYVLACASAIAERLTGSAVLAGMVPLPLTKAGTAGLHPIYRADDAFSETCLRFSRDCSVSRRRSPQGNQRNSPSPALVRSLAAEDRALLLGSPDVWQVATTSFIESVSTEGCGRGVMTDSEIYFHDPGFDPTTITHPGVIFSGGFGLLKKVNFKLVRMNTCVESGSDEHKKGTHDRGLRSRAGTT